MSGIPLTCFTSSGILENHQWKLLGQLRAQKEQLGRNLYWEAVVTLYSDKCYTTAVWMLSVTELWNTEGELYRVLYSLKVTPVRNERHWISVTGNQHRGAWIFPAQVLSLSAVCIWYNWSPYWIFYPLWGFGNCLLSRRLWIREEKKPTLNAGMKTVCHLRTQSLRSSRSSMCIFKGLHERKIDFHLLAKLPKIKKLFRVS